MNKIHNIYYRLGLLFFIIFWGMTSYLVLFASAIGFEDRLSDLLSRKPEAKAGKYFILCWFSTSILSPIMLHISNLRNASPNSFRNFVLEASRYMIIFFFLAPILFILFFMLVLGSISGAGLAVG